MTEQFMPLTMASPGRWLTVSNVRAGWGLQRRLAEMGLNPGVSIRVIDGHSWRGPMILDLRGSRLALGHGVAQKIMVKEA